MFSTHFSLKWKCSILVSSIHKTCFSKSLLACPCNLQQTADGEQWLSPCNSALDTIVVQCYHYGGLMNISHWQCKRGLLSFFGDLQTILHFALAVIFVGQPLLQSVTFPSFVHLSECGLMETKLFRDGFVTSFGLMSFFWGSQIAPLFRPWYISSNMCCEDFQAL